MHKLVCRERATQVPHIYYSRPHGYVNNRFATVSRAIGSSNTWHNNSHADLAVTGQRRAGLYMAACSPRFHCAFNKIFGAPHIAYEMRCHKPKY
jgi:hypothetical protein